MKSFLFVLAFVSGSAYANSCINRFKAIAKVEGEHVIHPYKNNKASVVLDAKSDNPITIKFDNSTCKVETVTYANTKRYNQTLHTIKKAYVDQAFCDFVRKHRGNLAQLPKDYSTYSCEKLNCGHYDQAAGVCYCNKEKMADKPAKTCCANGRPQENSFSQILADFTALNNSWLQWNEITSEFATESNKQCKEWSSLLAPVSNTAAKQLAR